MLLEMGVGALGLTMWGYTMCSSVEKPNVCEIKDYRELRSVKGDGLILSKNVRISRELSNEHALLVAPSGARKTRGFVMPNTKALSKCSTIITDPKCEIYEECKDELKGKKVLILNPFDSRTIGYDPLLNCRNTTEVRKIAKTLMINGDLATQTNSDKDTSSKKDWIDRSMSLVNSYMIFNYHTRKYPFHVMIRRLISCNLKEIGDEIKKSGVKEAINEFRAFIPIVMAKETLTCIRNTLLSSLGLFLDSTIDNIMDKKSIDFGKIRKEETTIFIQIPERDSVYYSPLTSVLISQMIDRLMEEKGLQVYFLFDEFCNIGYIPSLPQTLSTCRSREISISACIQSLAQFERVYGKHYKELRELFKTIMFTSGLKDSAEYFSNLLGTTIKKENGVDVTKQVLSKDEIRRLDNNKIMIVSTNKNPVMDTKFGCKEGLLW